MFTIENPCVCRPSFQASNTPHWSFLRNPVSSVTTASLTRGYKRVKLTISETLVSIFLIAVFRDEVVLGSTDEEEETVVLILLRVIAITSSDNSDKRFGYGDDFPLILG
jgi:hypothetical protein